MKSENTSTIMRLHPNDAMNEQAEKRLRVIAETLGIYKTANVTINTSSEQSASSTEAAELQEMENPLRLAKLRERVKEAVVVTIGDSLRASRGEIDERTFSAKDSAQSFAEQIFEEVGDNNIQGPEREKVIGDIRASMSGLILIVFHGPIVAEKLPNPDLNIEVMARLLGDQKKAAKLMANVKSGGMTDNRLLKEFYMRLVRMYSRPLKGSLKKNYSADFPGDALQFPKGTFTREHLKAIKAYLEEIFKTKFEEVKW